MGTKKKGAKKGNKFKLPKVEKPETEIDPKVQAWNEKQIASSASTDISGNASGQSTEEQRKMRENTVNFAYDNRGGNGSAFLMKLMRMMMNMFMTEERQIKVYGRKIDPMPDFRQEAICGGGFPQGVDRAWGDKYLRMSFEQKSFLPHNYELFMKRPNWEAEPMDVFKRLNTNHPIKLKWYLGPKSVGDIFPMDDFLKDDTSRDAYPNIMRHSFSNNPYHKQMLSQGTTHVAVGFVDLGILFAASLNAPPIGRNGPLHFLGVETSSYSVAKTLVIWEMLKQTPAEGDKRDSHLRSIAQVWFSTTWSEGTAAATKAALQSLSAPSKQKPYHPEVKQLLDHWLSSAPVSLQEARSQYADATHCARSSIGNLKRKSDRVPMAMYELTGDFALNGKPVVGNSLMFDCPDGTAPLDNDETCFSALNWKEVSKILSPETNVVEAAERYTLSNISKLAGWALAGDVTIELICAKIEDVAEDVAAVRPWTMSWSNVLDYFKHGDFHRMARACSIHGDTIHFGYSMNWPCSVVGTSLIDFQGPEHADKRSQIIDAANTAVETSYKMRGWSDYLRLPPPTNPLNTTSNYGLEHMHYRTWAEHFFDIARRDGPCNVANVEHGAFGSPLSPTGASSVSFTWTYDPKIKFA